MTTEALKVEHDRLTKWILQVYARRLLPNERVARCMRHVCWKRSKNPKWEIDVYTDGQTAWFKGLEVCGSVWVCPVCAARLSERRREELQATINSAVRQGGGVLLLTLTFPHGISDSLSQTLPAFASAIRRFKSGKAWQQLKRHYGLLGSAKALEVTHGQNGWHPHSHELLFTKRPLNKARRKMLENALYVLWRGATSACGLPEPTRAHGVDLQGATRAAQYVGKWGFSSELLRTQAKDGKQKGRNPWALLRDYALGDKRAGRLFQEYAAVFKGRRQLFWSPGLRELLCNEDGPIDQAAAARSQGEKVWVTAIDKETWGLVCKQDAHARVLELAVKSRDELEDYLNWLRENVPCWGGRFLGPRLPAMVLRRIRDGPRKSAPNAYRFALRNNEGGGLYRTDACSAAEALAELTRFYGERVLLAVPTSRGA